MPYNAQHYTAFVALLRLGGLPPKMAEPIGKQLANLDNNAQDQLIAVMADELQKSKSPPQ